MGILVRHRVLVSLVFDVIVGADTNLITPLVKVVVPLGQAPECGQVKFLEARQSAFGIGAGRALVQLRHPVFELLVQLIKGKEGVMA
ncbi:hypothetical protein D9M69_600470 [compost metagenome]